MLHLVRIKLPPWLTRVRPDTVQVDEVRPLHPLTARLGRVACSRSIKRRGCGRLKSAKGCLHGSLRGISWDIGLAGELAAAASGKAVGGGLGGEGCIGYELTRLCHR